MQVSKQNRLDAGKDVQRLSTRQIQRICRRHGWHCEAHKEPNVPNKLANHHRYRKSNSIKVARNGNWLPLGWRWNIEVMDEAQIVELLKALEVTEKTQQLTTLFREWQQGDEQEQRETYQALVDAGVIDKKQDPQ